MLDELEPGAPAEKKQRQETAGHDDERQTYPGAAEQPQGHADEDGAQPNRDARSQREWVPPGPPKKRPDQTPSENGQAVSATPSKSVASWWLLRPTIAKTSMQITSTAIAGRICMNLTLR